MRLVHALRLASILASILVVGGCRGDAVKCEQGCRNFATLVYRQNAEAKAAAAPPAERDAMRKQLLDKLDSELEHGIGVCVSQCQSANHTDDTECMIAAKTADQALACFK